jgi:hypothetical protein
MPTPKQPTPKTSPRFSPAIVDLYQRLHAVAESERMTALVDYLDDLCLELHKVAAELEELGFCAPSYLAGCGESDGFDCAQER